MVGERKRMTTPIATDALEMARQVYLKENLPNTNINNENILSLNKTTNVDISEEDDKKETGPKIIEKTVPEVSKEEPEKREESPTEKEARAYGWVPLEEYTGNKATWRDAESWIKGTGIYKELYETKKLNRELLDYLKNKDRQAVEMTFAELKQRKRELITAGDVDAVEKIEAQMDALIGKGSSTKTSDQNPPEVDDFLRRNDWFFHNEEMKQFAIDAENRYKRIYPSMSLDERLKKVETDTLKFYSKEEKPNIAPVETRRSAAPREIMPHYDETEELVRGIVDHNVQLSEFRAKQSKGKFKAITREQYITKLYKQGAIDKNGRLVSTKR